MKAPSARRGRGRRRATGGDQRLGAQGLGLPEWGL